MKTLYVHIGTPKTGTSAIQELCTVNRNVLESKGYCYPDFKNYYAGYSKRRNGMFLQKSIYRNGVRQIGEEKQRFQENMNYILHQFKIYDNVILSDEGIWTASYKLGESLWKDLKAAADRYQFAVKLIVYLRRQDLYMDSRWKQRGKGNSLKKSASYIPWEKYISDYPAELQLDYDKALGEMSAVLGKENIIVRRYERNRFPDGMIQADFLSIIGLELTDEYLIPKDTVNQSLSGNTCEIKRILNTLPELTEDESIFLRRVLLNYSKISEQTYPSSMFSIEEAKGFLEQFQEGNRRVAEEYLGEPGEELFDLSFKELPKWDKSNPCMMDDVIRFAAEVNISVLRRMEKENEALRAEIKEMKHKLRHPFRTAVKILLKKRK